GMCGLHDFFFSSRRRHTRLVSDWSSDVCSSDLTHPYSAGALVSTVDDLARWQAALDKDGLLSSESRKRMWTPVTLPDGTPTRYRSEEHTSELQSLTNLVCRLLLEKKKNKSIQHP